MKGILRSSGSTKEGLAFDYDPSGNRIAKHVYKPGGQLAYSTYYVRDAQGNIMSTYTFTDTASTPSFAMREQHLYGSSRLGIRKDSVELSIPVNLCNSPYSLSIAGLKQYELTNHLGNVLSVISDRKLPYSSSGSGSISYFQPEIVSATDYYPFGMIMDGRKYYSNTHHRFGFNGKELDYELKNAGNSIDFGFRIYDSRLGKFLSLDPLTSKYPYLSPYHFCNNSPILFKDFDGKDFGVEIKDNTIIIKATYYTDNNTKTIESTKAALGYINSFSDKFQFTDKTGKVYTIQFDLQLKGTDNTAAQNEKLAKEDDRANFITQDAGFPLFINGVTSNQELSTTVGQTLEGGDFTQLADAELAPSAYGVSNPDQFNQSNFTHEILHTLGVDHKAMSGENKADVTEQTVKSILKYAGKNNNDGNTISVNKSKGLSLSDNRKIRKDPENKPKTDLKSDSPSIKGSIKKK